MRRLSVSLLGLVLAIPALAQEPFGFDKGMTREQIIEIVGKNAIAKDKNDLPNNRLTLTTAPKAHPAFKSYVLYISPTEGLLRVVAVGNPVTTDTYGSELQKAYADVVSGISNKYGAPNGSDGNQIPHLVTNADQWMMPPYDKDRNSASLWRSPAPHIATMEVCARVTGRNTGYIRVVVEFVGWDQFVGERKAQLDTAF
jgi:hypothetical protein